MGADPFVEAIRAAPLAEEPHLVYADWLEERGEIDRAALLRVHLAMAALWPDHPHWHRGESELSALVRRVDRDWLEQVAPGLAPESGAAFSADRLPRSAPRVSRALQDTECDAWRKIEEAIEEAAASGRPSFAPLGVLTPEERKQIVTLPAAIGRLGAVRALDLYGSWLERIPLEIGGMAALATFAPYTSYRLHWLPYEITRCRQLRDSTVSTRALFGNLKNQMPFPDLQGPSLPEGTRLARERWGPSVRACSVCGAPFEDEGRFRVWISLRVATDVLPLLVGACSAACVERLPPSAPHHRAGPHRGGRERASARTDTGGDRG